MKLRTAMLAGLAAVALAATAAAGLWLDTGGSGPYPQRGAAGTVSAVQAAKAPCADLEVAGGGQLAQGHHCSQRAYTEIQAAIAAMLPTCEQDGQAAEAWAEVNGAMPHGYEVLARCAGTLPTTTTGGQR